MKRFAVPLLLLCVLAVCAATFELRGRVPFNSDQAIPALMALDILHRGAHPVFYYGAFYGGSVEPHVLAAAFAFLPATVATFRLIMAGFLACLAVVTWRTTRQAFGERAGIVAGLYLAAGPSFLIYKGLTSDGAYVSLMATCAVALHILLGASEALAQGQSVWKRLGLFGFCSGIAFWIHMPALFLVPVLVVAIFLGPWRRWLEARSIAAMAGGALLGAFPWLVTNMRWNWPSLGTSEVTTAGLARLPAQAKALVLEGWPILLGGGSAWSGESFAGARLVAFGLLVVVLCIGTWAALRDPSPRARRTAALCVATIVSVSGLTLLMARTDFSEPRYLLCGYVGVAPLVGLLVDRLWQRQKALGAGLAILILTLNAVSQWRAPQLRHGSDSRGYWGESDLDGVIKELDTLGVRFLYTSYWTAYRMVFATNERILATPFGYASNGVVRHRRVCTTVRSYPSPALLLQGDDLVSVRDHLDALGLPRDERAVGSFTLIRGLPREFADSLGYCSPLDALPSVEIDAPGIPDEMAAGSTAEVAVRLSTSSDRWISPTTRLSYRWRKTEKGPSLHEGARLELRPTPRPGASLLVPLRVVADLPPGSYYLVLDLIDDNVAWFEERGGTPLRKAIRITAAP